MGEAARFRTLEISDPRLEPEGLRFVTVKSAALRGRADLTLFAPPGIAATDPALPLVVLLHGVYGSHWSWAFQGGAHQTVARLVREGVVGPMVLAMPSDGLWGDGSGYLTHPAQDFESWIVREVPVAASAALGRTEPWRAIFLSGLSMGGFGALRLGAKHPERFQGVSAHSSITHMDQMGAFVEEALELYSVPPSERSVLDEILRRHDALPPLRFDCGIDDPLIEHNRELHRALLGAGIAHRYDEFPGAHDWGYWAEHVTDSLRFFHGIASGGAQP
jgi:enterochelin esterase-like enzyme